MLYEVITHIKIPSIYSWEFYTSRFTSVIIRTTFTICLKAGCLYGRNKRSLEQKRYQEICKLSGYAV